MSVLSKQAHWPRFTTKVAKYITAIVLVWQSSLEPPTNRLICSGWPTPIIEISFGPIKASVCCTRDHHDFKCFTVDSKYDADIIAYAVDSKYDAHELKVFLVDSKYDAQKKIFFVRSKYDL